MTSPVTPTRLNAAQIAIAPKVLLHDHLDGGLRAQSMIDMANESGYTKLPFMDADLLSHWYEDSCNSGSLELYLETFTHTIALMQTSEQIIRVARECVIDLANSGVVYAEVRGAPELFTLKDLDLPGVIDATIEGFKQGMEEVAHAGKKIRVESILCAMRQNNLSMAVAEEVVRYKGRGVVGFDIAGPEDGFPPSQHLAAFNYLRENNAHYTIHAGEAFGIASIDEALNICRAQRIGHGIRLIDDINFGNGNPKLGRLAQEILDQQVPLEMCPTSNLQTGGVKLMSEHPIAPMKELGFNVTLNTDNRLMSNTSMIREATQVVETFNWGLRELEDLATNAIGGAFISAEEKKDILSLIKNGYAEIL
ncbi:unannotated protein [freshwater metagenome]|uniref:adenosine deaminase n=1 Tax=freshwater metagenome TaxID=449393 RepID=A0A6J7XPZ8_9ZZZZ|nr:adenosine deaminase [Actinomycetota bacterium]